VSVGSLTDWACDCWYRRDARLSDGGATFVWLVVRSGGWIDITCGDPSITHRHYSIVMTTTTTATNSYYYKQQTTLMKNLLHPSSFHDLLLLPTSHYSVWSVKAVHNLIPFKRDDWKVPRFCLEHPFSSRTYCPSCREITQSTAYYALLHADDHVETYISLIIRALSRFITVLVFIDFLQQLLPSFKNANKSYGICGINLKCRSTYANVKQQYMQ